MSAPVPLRFVADTAALEASTLADLASSVEGRGVWAELQHHAPYNGFTAWERLQVRSLGPVRPVPHHAWSAKNTDICRVADVAHLPGFGLIAWADGVAPQSPAGAVLTDPARFAAAPGVSRLGDGFAFAPPDDAPELAAAGVFMPWGGRFNYGHFLVDALSSLLALHEARLTEALPPIAPPLKPWQRAMIADLDVGPVREIAAPCVHLRQAAYATGMDHFLQGPNPMVLRVRERLLAKAGRSPVQAERIYLSRRSHAHPMRVLLNEAELERALAARGFAVVRPERFSPAQQAAILNQAKVVVGPDGAGMANALFAEPGALVIDIQPQTVPGAWEPAAWVGAFGELAGHDWWTYYAPAPSPAADVPWVRRVRRGFRFGYHVPLDDILAELDGRL